MTRVRILNSIASADWSYSPGQLVELPDEQAAVWISSGLAEAASLSSSSITRGSIRVGGSGDAAIELSAKTAGNILIGNGTDLVSVPMSGDVEIAPSGVASLKKYARPSVWYPSGPPSSFAGGSPSIANCKSLVDALAVLMAQYALETSPVARIVQKATTANQSGSVSLNGVSGTLAALTAASESVPVDVMLGNPAMLKSLAHRLGYMAVSAAEAAILNLYSSLTTHTPVGTVGSALTFSVLDSLIGTLSVRGEQLFLVMRNVAPSSNAWSYPSGFYKGAAIVGSDSVKLTGAAPATTNNVMCTPSTFGLVSSIQTLTNDATHAQAVSIANGLAITIAITNTGSGIQTVSAQITGAPILLDAALGLQVRT